MNKWIDLSHAIDERTLPYPGDEPIQRLNDATYTRSGFYMDTLRTQMHVGTHVDSPIHFIDGGKSVDQLEVDRFIQKATVIHLNIVDGVICSSAIENELVKLPNVHTILLIDVSFSRFFDSEKYYHDVPSFEKTLVCLLEKYNISVLGLDLPTIQYQHHEVAEAHKDLLSRGIVLIEGLNHLNLCHHEIDFIGLPLNLKGWDGSFIRAVGKNCDEDFL